MAWQEPDDLGVGTQTPPTLIAQKLERLNWSSLAQVAGEDGNVAYYRLECAPCGQRRRLRPDKGRVPEDWGPGHVCAPVELKREA